MEIYYIPEHQSRIIFVLNNTIFHYISSSRNLSNSKNVHYHLTTSLSPHNKIPYPNDKHIYQNQNLTHQYYSYSIIILKFIMQIHSKVIHNSQTIII